MKKKCQEQENALITSTINHHGKNYEQTTDIYRTGQYG